jgi:glycosyltransferase involved in cell wall biosynthesis
MVGMPMVVADLPVLHEVLRADGSEPVAFVAPNDVEGWIRAIRTSLDAMPSPQAVAAFARTICRKYSRRRMIESYLSLFTEQPRHDRKALRRSALQTATREAQP